MDKVEILQPIYNDKVKKILQLLEEGFSVSVKFHYSTYRSMDGFNNRKNFYESYYQQISLRIHWRQW